MGDGGLVVWSKARNIFLTHSLVIVLLCGHTVVTAVSLIGIRLIERLCVYLWSGRMPVFFGVLPLEYVIHALDVVVLGVFGWCTARALYGAMKH